MRGDRRGQEGHNTTLCKKKLPFLSGTVWPRLCSTKKKFINQNYLFPEPLEASGCLPFLRPSFSSSALPHCRSWWRIDVFNLQENAEHETVSLTFGEYISFGASRLLRLEWISSSGSSWFANYPNLLYSFSPLPTIKHPHCISIHCHLFPICSALLGNLHPHQHNWRVSQCRGQTWLVLRDRCKNKWINK